MDLKKFIEKFFVCVVFGLAFGFSQSLLASSPKLAAPIYFIQNQGQVPDDYPIYGQGNGYQVFFSKKGITYSFADAKTPLHLDFVGTSKNILIPSQWSTPRILVEMMA